MCVCTSTNKKSVSIVIIFIGVFFWAKGIGMFGNNFFVMKAYIEKWDYMYGFSLIID